MSWFFLVGHVNVCWQFEDGVVRHVFVGLGMVYLMGSGMDAIDSFLFDIVCKRCLASWDLDFHLPIGFGELFMCSGNLSGLGWRMSYFHLDIVCGWVAVCSAQ